MMNYQLQKREIVDTEKTKYKYKSEKKPWAVKSKSAQVQGYLL